ncbi:MAG TPA: hypothetical protein VHQ47_11910 [Phycisphaerae bacterium]|nr:hypothetical protein [Phycisphaerae bacterium]
MTTNSTGTDVTVKRISSTYEVRGMLATLTSYDNATPGSGTALNQIAFTYNNFSQLTEEEQEHAGVVGGSTPGVRYGYASGASSSNQIRPTTLTYPDGRQIDFDYGTSGGMNDRLNRLNALIDDSTTTTMAAYTWLGQGTVIQITYTEAGFGLDLWGGTSGAFNGIDRFGRVIDQRWVTTGGSPTDLDRYGYGYDQDSNRLYRQNMVGSNLDEYYTYDHLNRLTKIVDASTSDTVAEYQYDGQTRRIVKKTYTSGTLTETRHFYWSSAWQDLEERVGSSTSADKQQVWGIRYVDELVCRDDAVPERIYVCQDANFNVTALVDTSASVLQRFIYEPYGQPAVLNASWASTTDSYNWVWRHQGLAWDVETGDADFNIEGAVCAP